MQNKQQAGVETTFLRRMQDFITEEQLLMPNSTVCCALSGGADSVALLLGMLSLRDVFSLTVTAVHINHHLRGAESDRDAQFCAALCQRLHVPLHIRHCDVKARQASTGGSIETVARECRYEIFAAETGLLATAHCF
jgi:tRNA(Ile)-lysidine synthase